jgi:DNA-binding response OmpR family regulator
MRDQRYDILLAHPNESQRDYYEDSASQCGFARVIAVATAREALDILRTTPVDALACPIELGDIDVWRFGRMIRSGKYGSVSLPIIALCETEHKSVLAALASDNNIHLVTMPDDINALGDRIAEIIDGRVRHSVLIIEDDKVSATASALALEKAYNVEVCDNGDEGLEAWMARRHDIVLLDVMLPGRSGPEILPIIMHENPSQVVIVLTAYSTRARHEELMFAGATEFLAKPFDIGQLNGLCDRLLHDHRLVAGLHDAQSRDAVTTRIANGARVAQMKLDQGLPWEASRHLNSALTGVPDKMSDDDWAKLMAITSR